MKNILVLIAVWVVLILVLPIYARAEDKAGTSASAPTTKINYQKLTKMDFEEKAVDGQFQRPDGQAVDADSNVDFDSLLAPRNDFQKELKRSSGAVR